MLLLPPFRASFKQLLTYKHDGDEKRWKVDEQFIVALKLGTRLLNNKLLKSITLCLTLTVFVFSPLCKGIEYLYENHLLKIDAQDVAQFLYKGEGLNKTAIGE